MALYSSLAQNKNQANGHVGDYQFKGYITNGGYIQSYSPGDSGYDNVHKEVVDLIFTKQDGGTLAALNKSRALGHPRSWTPVGGLAKPGKMKPLTPKGTLLPEVNVYPNKEADFVFDGGMLPEVVVGDQTPTIDGGVLPEVTVEAKKTPRYKAMFRPSVPSTAVGGPVEQSSNHKPWQGLLQKPVLPRTTADSLKNLPINEILSYEYTKRMFFK